MSKPTLVAEAKLSLPDDIIVATPIQTAALALVAKWRKEWIEFATKEQVPGASLTARVVRSKGPGKPKSPAAAPTTEKNAAAPQFATTGALPGAAIEQNTEASAMNQSMKEIGAAVNDAAAGVTAEVVGPAAPPWATA